MGMATMMTIKSKAEPADQLLPPGPSEQCRRAFDGLYRAHTFHDQHGNNEVGKDRPRATEYPGHDQEREGSNTASTPCCLFQGVEDQGHDGGDEGPAEDVDEVGVGGAEAVPEGRVAASEADAGRAYKGGVEVDDDEVVDESRRCP